MTRRYGRAPRGQRVIDAVPENWGENVTTIGALGLEGVRAAMSFEGALDGEAYEVFITQMLVPHLREGDVVFLDNLNVHKHAEANNAIRAAKATVEFLPPYSPDLNPIEQLWSKLKALVRGAKARTREALEQASVQPSLPSPTRTLKVGSSTAAVAPTQRRCGVSPRRARCRTHVIPLRVDQMYQRLKDSVLPRGAKAIYGLKRISPGAGWRLRCCTHQAPGVPNQWLRVLHRHAHEGPSGRGRDRTTPYLLDAWHESPFYTERERARWPGPKP